MYSEKDLVDLFWENYLWDFYPFTQHSTRCDAKERMVKPYSGKLTATREYGLPSGKRIDLFVRNKATERAFWIVEFKVEATVDALIQAWEYYEEVCNVRRKKSGYYAGSVSVAAQYFDERTLFFAEQMGIGCLHIAPINRNSVEVTSLREDAKVFPRTPGRLKWIQKDRRLAAVHG